MIQDDFSGQVSANTLFHFTNKADHLVSILRHEFRPHYCLEDLRVFGHSEKEYLELAIPLVSFCDLPLMQIKRHLSFYGSYGIGLSKVWGIKNRVCPVLYTYPDSPVGDAISKLLENYEPEGIDPDVRNVFKRSLNLLPCYVKPYEGNLWRDGAYIRGVKFYIEREWRYIPTTNDASTLSPLDKAEFMNDVERAHQNSKVFDGFRLSFHPKDIRYIVVRTEDEILSMVQSIRDIKDRFEPNIIDLLTTRIISAEQIQDDF